MGLKSFSNENILFFDSKETFIKRLGSVLLTEGKEESINNKFAASLIRIDQCIYYNQKQLVKVKE